MTRLTAVLGIVAFGGSVAKAAHVASTGQVSGSGWLQAVGREQPGYWVVWIIITFAALALAVRNTRRAPIEERRRARLFATGLVAGLTPMAVDTLLEMTIPAFSRFMSQPDARLLSGWIAYPLFLSIPFTTGYAVLVDEALTVRLVVRKAIGYALARATLLGVMAIPVAGLGWFLYQNRTLPVATMLNGPRPFVLAALTGATAVLLAYRRRLMNVVDRRFFREQYDSRQILGGLIDHSRSASTVVDACTNCSRTKSTARLHVDGVSLLLLDDARRQLLPVGEVGRPLSANSALAVLLSGSPDPLDVGLEDPTRDHAAAPARGGAPLAGRLWLQVAGPDRRHTRQRPGGRHRSGSQAQRVAVLERRTAGC